ncbi:MAG: cytidyltransferase-related enzyme [Parcubacteria group bacterium Gr01-1014_30]|nr:MAG: cytidyltransferase-related enzyme [Parcubacteria group bacterium Gr01-1014_30]
MVGNNKRQKKIVVAVSGGFDPVHAGHIQLFEEAKKLGSELVVILNNDNWLRKKKGYVFINQDERKKIVESVKWVDRVVISEHAEGDEDKSINGELKKVRPDIFANGGDRTKDNIPEVAVCNEINCKMVFNVGRDGKVQSSSWLLKKFLENVKEA